MIALRLALLSRSSAAHSSGEWIKGRKSLREYSSSSHPPETSRRRVWLNVPSPKRQIVIYIFISWCRMFFLLHSEWYKKHSQNSPHPWNKLSNPENVVSLIKVDKISPRRHCARRHDALLFTLCVFCCKLKTFHRTRTLCTAACCCWWFSVHETREWLTSSETSELWIIFMWEERHFMIGSHATDRSCT